MPYNGKSILVAGAGRSGISAARFLLSRGARASFRAWTRGVRPRHTYVRRRPGLRRDDPGAPVDLDPGHHALVCSRLRSLRRHGQRKPQDWQKPNYSHSMVAGGLDEMS